jgi:hypothetical protein
MIYLTGVFAALLLDSPDPARSPVRGAPQGAAALER